MYNVYIGVYRRTCVLIINMRARYITRRYGKPFLDRRRCNVSGKSRMYDEERRVLAVT